jgi:hypothetical protein
VLNKAINSLVLYYKLQSILFIQCLLKLSHNFQSIIILELVLIVVKIMYVFRTFRIRIRYFHLSTGPKRDDVPEGG